MPLSRLSIFALADRRLAWVGQRQAVLAENIAHADTPGWRARDLRPFADLLARPAIGLLRTDPRHLPDPAAARAGTTILPGEAAPDGNTVQIDQQMAKLADTETTQRLVTGLYTSWMSMARTAIGR